MDKDEAMKKGLELTRKIQQFYPNYEFLYDADGNITDVTQTEPTETVPEVTTEQRVSALEDAMEAVINILMEE